jgi:hypothetical protein
MNLPKELKTEIINNHVKDLKYRRYSIELDVLLENAKTSPSSDVLLSLQASVDEIDGQLAALDSELAAVGALEE